MNITKNLVPVNKYGIKCPHSMTPTRIVVHNTSNDATAQNEIAYMIRNDNYTSFHYAVDDIEIVQGIEENRNAWHSGDGDGKGNREGIAIEICYSKSGGNKFEKAEKNAVKLIVDIIKRYNWGIDKVTKHQDYSGKYCPHRTLDNGWYRFLNMIKEELHQNVNEEEIKMIEELRNEVAQLRNEVADLRKIVQKENVVKKSVDEVAREVIAGQWGNGQDRTNRLTAEGYNAKEIQNRVNELLR